jgi:peptidoglycan hydrolase CwlO-like protein
MSQDSTSFLGWVLAGVSGIIATLAGALATVYRNQIKDYERERMRLEQEKAELQKLTDAQKLHFEQKIDKMFEEVRACHEEHSVTREKFARIDERLKLLEAKGCLSVGCAIEKKSQG